jgi:hypothetical protein
MAGTRKQRESVAEFTEKMTTRPQEEHRWLERFLGEWTVEGEATMGPDQPPVTFEGSEVVRSIGGLWIVAEGEGEMPGGGASTGVLTLGYDPGRKRFVGTYIASMMAHMWVYDGTLDAAARVLTLDTEGPSMTGDGGVATYQDTIELRSDDHRVMTSRMRDDDGGWYPIMTAHYRRAR